MNNLKKKIILSFLGIIFNISFGFAQSQMTDSILEPVVNPSLNIVNTPSQFSWFNSFEFGLALMISIFCTIILILEFFLIKHDKIKGENAMQVYLVTVIIYGSLFLVAAGFNNDHIAPIIGLLGTIAGYMLSGLRNDKNSNNNDEKKPINEDNKNSNNNDEKKSTNEK